MRFFRLIIGSLVIVGALYILVGEQMSGASSNAFVNAPLVTMRAPVAGDIAIANRPVGAEVPENSILFTMNDTRADRVHLDDLMLEQARIEAEIDRLSAQKAAAQARLGEVELHYAAYSSERTRELEDLACQPWTEPLYDLTDPKLAAIAGIDDGMADGAETEAEQLVSRGAAPEPADLLPKGYGPLDLRLNAAARGIYTDDNAGAAWNFAYWRVAARFDLARVDAELAAATASLTAYVERIGRERVRLIGLTGGDVASPVSGVLWEQMVKGGVNVQRGDPIMKLADCGSAVVSLSVSEIVYNTLRTGDPATFRFSGSKEVVQGTIARLAGAGAATIYEDMAVKPSREHLERYDVTLFVPELRGKDLAGGCNIGRTGRVFFDNRPLDPLRRLFN